MNIPITQRPGEILSAASVDRIPLAVHKSMKFSSGTTVVISKEENFERWQGSIYFKADGHTFARWVVAISRRELCNRLRMEVAETRNPKLRTVRERLNYTGYDYGMELQSVDIPTFNPTLPLSGISPFRDRTLWDKLQLWMIKYL